jgi:hypothetical protein
LPLHLRHAITPAPLPAMMILLLMPLLADIIIILRHYYCRWLRHYYWPLLFISLITPLAD